MPRLSYNREQYNEAKEAPGGGSFDPVPEGVYEATIEGTDIKQNRAGSGEYLKMKWRISGGQYGGRIVWDNITTSHQDDKSAKMGMSFLSKLCTAVGLSEPPDDTERLHGRPCAIRVIIREQEGYPPDNKIRGYYPLEAAGRVSPEAVAPVNNSPYKGDDDIPF